MRKNIKTWAFLLAVLPSLLALVACNPLEDDSKSSTYIVVESMSGKDATGKAATFLQSDVVAASGTIFADVATAVIRAALLDPDPLIGSSAYNDVILDRYVVTYSRVDGKNREGVDVPYSFEGALTQVVKVGGTSSISFVIVREVAKAEPPLSELVKGTGDGVIEMTAKVEFYGHDQTNHTVKAVGYLTIFFANYAG
jgi:hypothetical protein